MQFNEVDFLKSAQKIHLKLEEIPIYETIPDAEVRKKLDEFIDYGKNPRFSKALDEICENIVGRTMFKVLMTKLQTKGKRMYIVPYEGNGSRYNEYVVYVNLSFYEKNGDGVTLRRYFYIDDRNEIKLKLKSLAGSIFHEFCHGLHHVSGKSVFGTNAIIATHKIQYAWDDDEELRAITCFDHDPICDHCFDFCQSILKGEEFLPRYSHGGHSGIGELEAKKEAKI